MSFVSPEAEREWQRLEAWRGSLPRKRAKLDTVPTTVPAGLWTEAQFEFLAQLVAAVQKEIETKLRSEFGAKLNDLRSTLRGEIGDLNRNVVNEILAHADEFRTEREDMNGKIIQVLGQVVKTLGVEQRGDVIDLPDWRRGRAAS